MSDYTLICDDERRRRQVRKAGLNGLDYVEVSDDQMRLSVYFINTAPDDLEIGNFRIEGGERIRDIEIVGLEFGCSDEQDPQVDVCLQLTVNKPGDFSTYKLCWVVPDKQGHPTQRRDPRADPRYGCVEFSFKANCPTGLDCKDESPCPPTVYQELDNNYLAKDYASFRQLILDRLALTMPTWKESHVPDIGMMLVELLAYVGDYLSYYQDAVATEAYLETARQRISVRRHTRLVDYAMHEGCNARAWVCVGTAQDMTLDGQKDYFITGYNERLALPETVVHPTTLREISNTLYDEFHPVAEGEIHLYKDHSEIYFYTWGNQLCCLPEGTRTATLRGRLYGAAWEKQVANGLIPFLKKLPTSELKEFFACVLNHIGSHAFNLTQTYDAKETYHNCLAEAEQQSPYPQPLELQITAVMQSLDKTWQTHNLPSILSVEANVLRQCLEDAIEKVGKREERDCVPEGRRIRVPDETLELMELLECLEDFKQAAPSLTLDAGMVLIFEEMIGPETINPVDADPTHRQAVRLTKVRQACDPAYNGLPVVEIEWAAEDALTFSLCLSVISPAPECALIENVSVARGNVVLVDHGRWLEKEPLGKTKVIRTPVACEGEDNPTDTVTSLERLKPPPLKFTPVTFRQTLPSDDTPASRMLTQDPREAVPQVELLRRWRDEKHIPHDEITMWKPVRDLLMSSTLDEHFVVEIDNDGRAHLRFGDGVQGRIPPPSPSLYAHYRIGNGKQGNVGAEAINHVVTEQRGVNLSARNPLPAHGGTEPEPMEAVKLFAPGAFNFDRKRAVTPEDYAWLAQHNHPAVQRAAATARWTGSWYEILVALDPTGNPDDEHVAKLTEAIESYLADYQRIGHDIAVKQAQYANLDIEVCVNVLPQFFRGHILQSLRDTFSNRRLPDGRLGFFHPDNLSFGEGIYLSKIIAAAQSVQGVESVWVTRLQRMFDPIIDDDESSVIAEGVMRLGPLEVARLENDMNFAEHGRITFKLEGGR
jgi:predicted phage baseplate assembly protein